MTRSFDNPRLRDATVAQLEELLAKLCVQLANAEPLEVLAYKLDELVVTVSNYLEYRKLMLLVGQRNALTESVVLTQGVSP